MKDLILPSELFVRNRKKLVKKLTDESVAIITANDEAPRNGDQNYPYRQNSNLFYFTGINQEKTILVLCPHHPIESMREILFIVKPDELMTIWYGHKLTVEEAVKISGVKTIRWIDDFYSTMRDLVLRSENIYFCLNEYLTYTTDVPSRDFRMIETFKKSYPLHKYKRLYPIVEKLRLCKEPEEIEILKTACELTKSAFERTLKFVKPGVLEYEIEAEVTHEFIRRGASGHAYYPIIASGKNACILHYIENKEVCKKGDLLLMDFGAELCNYAADLSRTIPVSGKFTKRQKACYNAVLRVMKQAQKMIVPGNTIDNINKECNILLEEEMIGLGLFSAKDVKKQNASSPLFKQYFMHGISHFIGLDVHDAGNKQTPLKAGMVLSCEPGLYIAEEGLGIRIENDIVVDKNPIDLMKNIPVEADELEELMNKK